jgi:repressor LexA
LEIDMRLTRRQRDCLVSILEITDGQGYPPTLSEIAAHMGLSNRSTAHAHVSHLAEMGLVSYRCGRSRTVTLTAAGREEAV